ncbi:MAG: hypothetical protein M1816_005178 [Peltula sp. TS41687]|nr:MAG: hypothetical protein M1816_005178 [Peltula sp. TS41687]
MASEQTSFVLSSSSGSSVGLQSEHGTPDTKDTVFSPEKTRFNSKSKALVKGETTPVPARLPIQRSNYALPKFLEDASSCHGSDWDVDETDQLMSGGTFHSPFIPGTNPRRHRSAEHKLSPTASCFTPGTGKQTPESSNSGSIDTDAALTRTGSHEVKEEPVSTTDPNGDVKRHLTCVANGSNPYPTSSTQVEPSSSSHSREGGRVLAVTANTTSEQTRNPPILRSLVVKGNTPQGGSIIATVPFKNFMTNEVPAVVHHHTVMDATIPGKMVIGFSVNQDCEKVIDLIRTSHPDWIVEHTDPQALSHKIEHETSLTLEEFLTHVFVKVRLEAPYGIVDAETVKSLLPELLKMYGELKQTSGLNVAGTDFLCMIAKYHHDGNRTTAVVPVNCFPFGSGHLRLIHCQSVQDNPTAFLNDYFGRSGLGPSRVDAELAALVGRTSLYPTLQASGGNVGPGNSIGDPFFTPTPFVNPVANQQPTRPGTGFGYPTQMITPPLGAAMPHTPLHGGLGLGSPYPPHETGFAPGTIGQERFDVTVPRSPDGRSWHNRRYSTGSGSRRGGSNFVGNNNTVDIQRIREGLDVRTTIMLRNIPNKIDQPMLKEIVDETSHGKYDFMYLRIDFANNCNVGYAFINFEDPYDIIDFVKSRAGYRWNRFNSDKVAEVSYATIQGKDCLVAKFRNSSVMLELPAFRPKVFHTGTGPLAGTEAEFPTPDNHSKMRRSVENAAHVGLYSPGGNNPRHDSRRRRSRFDRGTRFAQMEEANNYIPADFPRLPMFPRLPRVPETMENQDNHPYGGGPFMNRGMSQGYHYGGDDGLHSNFHH